MTRFPVPNQALLCVSLFTAAACSDRDPGQQAPAAMPSAVPAVPVIVEPLRLSRANTTLETVGTSRAIRSIELHPAASGEVVAVHFEPGQQVASDEVLVALERREEELAVALAEVRLREAERLYQRYRRSGESGAVLPTDIDAARTAAEAARIEVERARIALDYRTIRAPFAGFVGITEVDPGDRVNPDTVITTLDDRGSLLVSFDVPETLNGQIRVGDAVEVASWGSRQPAAIGQVADIDSRIDPATRTFVARGRVPNGEDALRPGMSFRVTIEVAGTAYPAVAETAVQWGADGAYVWSVVDGQAQREPVGIVQRRQGHVLIDTELGAGALVVVEGIQRMRNGLEVSYEPPGVARKPGETVIVAKPPESD